MEETQKAVKQKQGSDSRQPDSPFEGLQEAELYHSATTIGQHLHYK